MAVGIEPFEILDQLGHRLKAIRGIGLEALGDERSTALGNRRVDRCGAAAARCCMRSISSATRSMWPAGCRRPRSMSYRISPKA